MPELSAAVFFDVKIFHLICHLEGKERHRNWVWHMHEINSAHEINLLILFHRGCQWWQVSLEVCMYFGPYSGGAVRGERGVGYTICVGLMLCFRGSGHENV